MRRKIRRIIRIVLQIIIGLFILCMGVNIIARGTKMLYGKTFSVVIKEAANEMTGRVGLAIMKRTGSVFSYLYDKGGQDTLISKILEKVYMANEYEKNHIIYMKEDSICKNIIADCFAKNQYDKENQINDSIPVISVIPEYDYDKSEDKEVSEGQVEEVLSPFIRPLPPPIIGMEYTLSQLLDFNILLRNFYSIEANTGADGTILDASRMINADMSLPDSEDDYPQILIFHTHAQEAYADSRDGIIDDTVVGMGAYLAEILERDYGYKVMHVTTSFDYVDGKLDRSKAYEYAREAIEVILATYPTIEVMLDIHRDGVKENVHLVTEYGGKKVAKIMFVNGISRINDTEVEYLQNPNLKDNLAFSFQLQLKGEAYFPGLMRRIIIKAYRYNLDLKPKSALVELGAQTNTVAEARNAIELLAIMLGEVLQ